jgi:hypothetical protein
LAERTGVSSGRLSGLVKRGDYTTETALRVIGAYSIANQKLLMQAYINDIVEYGREFGVSPEVMEPPKIPKKLEPMIQDIVRIMATTPHLENALRAMIEVAEGTEDRLKVAEDRERYNHGGN